MATKPNNWSGNCNFTNFTYNKKIIGGATHGNGCNGNFVKDAMVFGEFNYMVSGIAPRAQLAIY